MVMELNKEMVCKVDGQEEGLVVFVMAGSLNHCQNHLRVEVISQCPPRGVVGNLNDHGILDLHWTFEHMCCHKNDIIGRAHEQVVLLISRCNSNVYHQLGLGSQFVSVYIFW